MEVEQSAPNDKKDEKVLKKSLTTLENYRQLVDVEIRSLLRRSGELTATVDHLLIEVGSIALRIEEAGSNTDRVLTRMEFLKSEFDLLKRKTALQESNTNALHQRMLRIEEDPRDIDEMYGRLLRLEADVRNLKKQNETT